MTPRSQTTHHQGVYVSTINRIVPQRSRPCDDGTQAVSVLLIFSPCYGDKIIISWKCDSSELIHITRIMLPNILAYSKYHIILNLPLLSLLASDNITEHSFSVDEAHDALPQVEVRRNLRRLYVSHFLATWGDRMWYSSLL